jgi:hypothetical protein
VNPINCTDSAGDLLHHVHGIAWYFGYLVPTNADIPELDPLFVGEFEDEASPLGVKGLGELTAVSVTPRDNRRRVSRDRQEST